MEDCLNLSLTERISLIEKTCKLHSGRMDTFQHEIKLALTEINIIISWIQKHFDVELIKNGTTHQRCTTGLYLAAEENGRNLDKVIEENSAEDRSSSEDYEDSEFQEVGKPVDSTICDKKTSTSKSCKAKTEAIVVEYTPVVEVKYGTEKATTEAKSETKGKIHVQCEECGKVLKGPGSLRAHMRTHSNLRPHQCSQCGKAFRMKHHLEFHLLVHSGKKEESCRFCGKSFLAKRDLLRHERTHTGEKPFKCQYCPKSFNVKQHLTLHIRTHTGERPYKCSICEKTFTQANSLRIHKKIHFKESMIDEKVVSSRQHDSSKSKSTQIVSIQKQNATTKANLIIKHI